VGSGIGSSSLLRSGNLLGASSAAQQYLYPLSCAWQAVAPRAIGALSPLELSPPLSRARESLRARPQFVNESLTQLGSSQSTKHQKTHKNRAGISPEN